MMESIRDFLSDGDPISPDPNSPNPNLKPVFGVKSLEDTHILSMVARPVKPNSALGWPNFPDVRDLKDHSIYVVQSARDSRGNRVDGQYRAHRVRITSVENTQQYRFCTVSVAYLDGSGRTLDKVRASRIFWLPEGAPVSPV